MQRAYNTWSALRQSFTTDSIHNMEHLLLVVFLALLGGARSVPVYGRYETCVPANTVKYYNPFNYTEVYVQGSFTGPDGDVTVDGFYYQAYTRSNAGGTEMLTPDGPSQWCVRYAPRNPGSFQVTVTITNSSGTFTLMTDSFQALDANLAGFIQLSSNGVHFQFTNKSTYYPVGENVCWVAYSEGTYGYDNYFGKLSAAGANYARLWLTDVAFDGLAVEINVANMSLPDTWRLDYVVELAEKLNMHLLMCTESFNYFCTVASEPCNWNICYYNIAYGGFLDKPSEFFTDERAKADYKNRLRYLVARYGYSTSVFAWEFFNEVDGTDNYDPSVQLEWNEEMSSYLRSVDVYNHLISTSFANSDGDQNIQASSALDFTMTHNYGANDIAGETAQYALKKVSMYKKPSYVAEFGINNEDSDKEGVSLHNGVWAPLFLMGAGTCMTWWWDSWVEPNNLYYHYKPFSDFVSRLQLAEYTWTSISPKVMANTTDVIRAWGIAGKGEGGKELVLTWIQDECYTWPNQSSGKACPTFAGFKLTASCAIPSGNYEGHWFNTHSGRDIATTSVVCENMQLNDEIPTFTEDIAVYYYSA